MNIRDPMLPLSLVAFRALQDEVSRLDAAIAAPQAEPAQAQGVPDYHVWAIDRDGYPFKLRGSVPIPAGTELAAAPQAEPAHTVFKTGDAGAPEQIKDRNGEVVLALCKSCGKVEIELQGPCVAPQPKREPITPPVWVQAERNRIAAKLEADAATMRHIQGCKGARDPHREAKARYAEVIAKLLREGRF